MSDLVNLGIGFFNVERGGGWPRAVRLRALPAPRIATVARKSVTAPDGKAPLPSALSRRGGIAYDAEFECRGRSLPPALSVNVF
jgi:hypothetical protein